MFRAKNRTTLQTPGPRNAEMKRLTLSFLRRKVARPQRSRAARISALARARAPNRVPSQKTGFVPRQDAAGAPRHVSFGYLPLPMGPTELWAASILRLHSGRGGPLCHTRRRYTDQPPFGSGIYPRIELV